MIEDKAPAAPAPVIDSARAAERAAQIISALEDKALASGSSFRTILARAGVEHSTYCRWKKQAPETLQKLAAIELAAEALMAERAPN